jgi:oxygen-independent coproporphyrinogen III oxidase
MAGVNANDHGRFANLSLYLHIPFCQLRCAYCDFNTYAGLDELIPAYVQALVKEIRLVGKAQGCQAQGSSIRDLGPWPLSLGPCSTLFFGGGTPSLLPLSELALIFNALRDSFALTPDCEITLEANPGTVDQAYLEGLRALGVNRLSFGVQSSHPAELKLLDRLHTFDDVILAVQWARAAGFDNLNLDLIFGIPHQTLTMWQETLTRALELQPDHLSCYALSLEHGTPLRSWVYRGLLPMPDSDLAAEMYEWASETLEANGFRQYEISNWAKEVAGGRWQVAGEPAICHLPLACRHNLQYWRNLPYLGLGAGAHGYAAGWRYSNVLAPAAYIARLEEGGEAQFPFSPAVAETIQVPEETAMGEMMMLGMRLTREGVRDLDFRKRFGIGLGDRYPKELRKLKELRLIEWDDDGARLTKSGRLLGNRVFREFV